MTGTLSDKLNANRAANLVSSMGGPSLDQRDIEWANDLESGRLLLDWLSSQIHGDHDDGLALSATMWDSALEPDEVIISSDERVSRHVGDAQDHMPAYRSDYMTPSQLRKHANFITNETSDVQQEAALFRARISQAKEASKKISNSIKMLQRAMYDLNAKLRGSEETLSELSITADTTVSATIAGSQELLVELGMLPPQKEKKSTPSPEQTDANLAAQEYADLEAARNILSKSKGNIATLVENFQENTINLDQLGQQDAARAADLQVEASRLQSTFDAIESRTRTKAGSSSGLEAILDPDVIAELQAICDTLEKEVSLRDKVHAVEASGGGALDSLLSELHEGYIADKQSGKGQWEPQTIHDQLRHAWVLDQAAILQLHEEALDEALFALDSALAPLEQVYSSLSRLAQCVQEAEAVLEAYAEELGDIYLNGSQSQGKEHRSQRNAITEAAQDDVEMEKRLRDVFNDCKNHRLAGAGPLVLLTREDILAELHSLKARSARVEGSEKAWADAVIQKYSIRPIHPLLPQIYAHAPTNTSPPFAFPDHVRALEARARSRAAELHGLAEAVDGEVRETFVKEGNSKKLDAFVEKWASIGGKEED